MGTFRSYSAKTPSVQAMRRHIEDMLRKLEVVVRLNCSAKVTSLGLMQYGRRQKAINAICQRIVRGSVGEDDDRTVVVAFGAANFPSSFGKGNFPGPNKAIRAGLLRMGYKVLSVNEYNTSQMCFLCFERLVPMCDAEGNDIYAVRRCLNVECPNMTIDRDTNAALNILGVSKHIECCGFRPAAFSQVEVASTN